MPYYEYRCNNCGRAMRLFIAYEDYDDAKPHCKFCESQDLRRRVTRIALAKSEERRLDSLMDDSTLDGIDEEDPRALGRFMRKMSSEMGEDMGDDFNEVVDRLERGESPESIEESMPDLGSEMGDEF